MFQKYENDLWIVPNGNPEEWAVAYHGFGLPHFALPKILNEGMRQGMRGKFG